MRKQEDEKLERRLHQVMEQIQPDEDAKDRMYLEIMRRASVAETPPAKPKPWYLRWQTSAGACTAALLCVVVVAAAVHGRMPQGGTGQLDIVSPAVTTQASELPADTEQPDETETRPQAETTAAETGVTVHSAGTTAGTAAGNASAAAESSTVPAEDKIVSPVSPEITVPQKPQQQETQPVVTTAAPQTKPVQTTAAATTVPKAETTAVPETVTKPPATTASSVETVPIRQNIYLYYKLTWEGNPYDTDYMEVSSSSLDQYLGYGVTRGNDVEDTYTVLIYSIVGVDPVQQVAVQYAGEEKYYVFTIQ